MFYALLCQDKPGALEIRKANRDAHLAYLKDTGVVTQAGPLLSDAGEMCGSLVVIDVETRAEAESWAANDPYALAELFEKVDIHCWNRVIAT